MSRAVVPSIEDLASGVRHAGCADDLPVAPCAHGLVTRVAVGHEAAREAVEEQLRAVPVTTDREV